MNGNQPYFLDRTDTVRRLTHSTLPVNACVTVHGFSAILPVAEAQWDRGEL
jgi:hypothetical protein